MPPRQSTGQKPTHHLVLSDGVKSIGLTLCDPRGNANPLAIQQSPMPKTSLQTTQGDPDYGSFRLPYVTATEKDFSGGRGWEEFNKDSTRYRDSWGIDARGGDIILGPDVTDLVGIYSHEQPATDNTTVFLDPLSPVDVRMASKYRPITARILTHVRFRCSAWWKENGTSYGPPDMILEVYNTVGDSPGALQAFSVAGPNTISGYEYPNPPTSEMTLKLQTPIQVAADTDVWIALKLQGSDANVLYARANNNVPTNKLMTKVGAGAWTEQLAGANHQALWFEPLYAEVGIAHIFDYQALTYLVSSAEDGASPLVFQNGLRGAVTATNASDKTKTHTNLNLKGLNLVGCKLKIVAGNGKTESINWRTITAHTVSGLNDTITVSPPWHIMQNATTRFVIIGMKECVEITGHGMTATVTDVQVVGDIIFFAMGETTTIRRARLTDNVNWNFFWDGTSETVGNKATFLELIQDTKGEQRIWRALATASTVSKAAVPAWNAANAASLSFGKDVNGTFTAGQEIICGNTQYKITGMTPYGEPSAPWIFKEDCFGAIGNDIFSPVPLAEISVVRDERNGHAATSFGVYLLFSMLEGMERYYENRLDDIGPNLDAGFETDRKGSISFLIPYPGGVIACYDADDGYSSILFWNQLGWHELYRSATPGARIRRAFVQVIPGNACDRLLFSEGTNVRYLAMAMQPRRQPDYRYAASGEIITSWIKTGFAEINKFWRSLVLYTEGLSETVTVDAYYQRNEWDEWTALPGTYTQSPMQELPIADNYLVTGKRIRFKFVLSNDGDRTKTPRIIAFNLSTIVRVPPATSWSITVLAASQMQNEQGRWTSMTEQELLLQVRSWANSNLHAEPISLAAEDPAFDEKLVFIDPATIVPISLTVEAGGQKRTKKVLTFGLVEVEKVGE